MGVQVLYDEREVLVQLWESVITHRVNVLGVLAQLAEIPIGRIAGSLAEATILVDCNPHSVGTSRKVLFECFEVDHDGAHWTAEGFHSSFHVLWEHAHDDRAGV